MEIARLRTGSLEIVRTEESASEAATVYQLTLKRPMDRARLATSYEAVVHANPPLRVKRVGAQPGHGLAWTPLTPGEVDATLARERQSLSSFVSLARLLDASVAEERLPFRVALVDDWTLVVLIHPTWARVHGGLEWLEQLLASYGGDDVSSAALAEPASRSASAWRRIARTSAGVLWGLMQLLGVALGRKRGGDGPSVDLSRTRPATPRSRGYAVRTYELSVDETARASERARDRGLSVVESLTADMARALLEAQPDRSRVNIWLPGAVASPLPGSAVLSVSRDRDLERQVRRGFDGLERCLPGWMTRLFAATPGHGPSTRGVAAPEPLSCAISSAGVLEGERLAEYVATVHLHARTQTIYLGTATLHDRMSFEVCVPLDRFDDREVFAVTNRARALLLGAPSAEKKLALAVASA